MNAPGLVVSTGLPNSLFESLKKISLTALFNSGYRTCRIFT